MEQLMVSVLIFISVAILFISILYLLDIPLMHISLKEMSILLIYIFSIVYFYHQMKVIAMLLIVLGLLSVVYYYRNHPKYYIYFLALFFVNILCENLPTLILTALTKLNNYNLESNPMWVNVLGLIIYGASMFISMKGLKFVLHKYDAFMPQTGILIFLTFMFGAIIAVLCTKVIYDTFSKGQSYRLIAENMIFYILIMFFLIILMMIIMWTVRRNLILRLQEKERQDLMEYIESIESVNMEMRKFRHDYINILSSMRTYIDDKNYDGLTEFFYEHILKTREQLKINNQDIGKLSFIQLPGAKGVLTTKIIAVQNKNIPFDLEITEPIDDINMDIISFNRIFGIMFDNAIEATLESKTPSIRLAIIKQGSDVLIVMMNQFNNINNIRLNEIFKPGFSTKVGNRGIGLSTLREITDKLPQVDLNTRIEQNLFIHELCIRGG